MRLTDPISDMLTRMRNALMVKHEDVAIPYSKIKESIADLLKSEGYIKDYKIVPVGIHRNIVVVLKYTDMNEPVIRGLKRISKPGGRVYINTKNLNLVLGGLGNGIVSTSAGIKTVKQCLTEKVGGEYLCQIW